METNAVWQIVKSRAFGVTAIVLLMAGIGVTACARGPQAEAAFPSKPIRIINGWSGGSLIFIDNIAREASETLGVSVEVVDKVGNTGLDALEEFKKAPEDGYTLVSTSDIYVSSFARGEIDINPAEDWVPLLIGNVSISQIYIRPDDQRYSSWDDLVAYAKEQPGLKIATVGTPLSMEGLIISSLEESFGVQFERAPYDHSKERYAALLGGDADLIIEQPGDVKERLESGEFKPILTLWKERVQGFEDVPTVGEKGGEFVPVLRTRGLAVSKDVPAAHIEKLRTGLRAAFNSEGYQRYLAERRLDLVPYPEDPIASTKEHIETYRRLYE